MSDYWKQFLELEYADKFTDYGCHITGNLVVVRCREAWDRHPRQGVFGSMSCFDVSDEAERLIREKHPNAVRKLSLPDVVMEIPDPGAKTP
jgi:hypothetical protein